MPISQDFKVGGNKSVPQEKIEEGIYTAKIIDITYIPINKESSFVNDKFKQKEQFAFRFKIIGSKFNDFEVRSWTSLSFNKGWESEGNKPAGSPSSLYLLACAVEGQFIDDTLEFNPATLLGKKLQIVVEDKRKSDGSISSKVSKYLKLPQDIEEEEIPIPDDEEFDPTRGL